MNQTTYKIVRPSDQILAAALEASAAYRQLAVNRILSAFKYKKEVLVPASEACLNAIRSIEEKLSPPRKLFEIENGRIKFKSKFLTKSKSQGTLLLAILIEAANEDGFLSYDEIEKRFIANGLKPISDKVKRLDRIHHSIEHIKRFIMKEDKEYEGEKIIQTVKHEGVRIYNPLMTK